MVVKLSSFAGCQSSRKGEHREYTERWDAMPVNMMPPGWYARRIDIRMEISNEAETHYGLVKVRDLLLQQGENCVGRIANFEPANQ